MAYVHYKYRPPFTVSFVFNSRAGADQLISGYARRDLAIGAERHSRAS
jgi:hypothetical protein